MRKGSHIVAWFLVAVVVLAAEVHETAAVTCDSTELISCAPAITGSGDPSPECCSKLKEQEPCFCTYINDPSEKGYIDSPNAQRVATACGVTIPTNC